MRTFRRIINSPIGPLLIAATEHALTAVRWHFDNNVNDIPEQTPHAAKILNDAQKQLEEYFSGKRYIFALPLYLEGTTFQKNVWQQLGRIPFASVCSYKQLATAIHRPHAYRAVGNANGNNPISIIVPCHRVIAADGSLGGYSAGIAIKQKLLELEQQYQPHSPSREVA